MPKTRRTVEYQGSRPKGRGGKLWGYGYSDLARMLNTTEGALRARVFRGTFSPWDLDAVFKEWAAVRGVVVGVALALVLALVGCGEITSEDFAGTGGARAMLGIGGSGAGGAAATGTGGSWVAGSGGASGGVGGAGAGGARVGTGGRIAGTGGATPGVGGAVAGTGGARVIPSCAPVKVDTCGNLNANGSIWDYMFKDGIACASCFNGTNGTMPVTTECVANPSAPRLCVRSCSECAYAP